VAVRTDGGAIALHSGDRIHLLSPTGDVLATLPGEVDHVVAMAFDPSGENLAVLSPSRLRTWDLANEGRQLLDSGLAVESPTLLFLDQGQLLIGDRIVEADSGMTLRQIEMPMRAGALQSVGDKLAVSVRVNPRMPPSLIVVAPPDTAGRVQGRNLLDRGRSVGIVINGLEAEQARRVREYLTAQLAALQVTVADDTDATLTISSKPGETVQQKYRFAGFEERQASVRQQNYEVVLADDKGRVAWRINGGFTAPGFIRLEEDETLDGAITRLREESVGFFDAIELPPAAVVTETPVWKVPLVSDRG
jgi:hypothetical protein